MYRLMMVLVFIVFYVEAKQKITEETEPTTQYEMTCHAAVNKWICAARDQDKVAYEKAYLIRKEHIDNMDSAVENVELSTIKPVPDFNAADTTINVKTKVESERINNSSVRDNARVENERPISVDDKEKTQSIFAQWLKKFPNAWTIQVIGVSDRSGLSDFFQQHNLDKKQFIVVETQNNGKPWWIVIFNYYVDRQLANQAITELPFSLQKQVWIRPLRGITVFEN